MAIKFRNVFVMAFCVFLFGAGCYLLAFAGAILCCRSGYCGESFWQLEKFVYGLLPLAAGILFLALAARLWVQAYVRILNAGLVGCVVAAFVVVGDIALFLWHVRAPEEVNSAWEAESGVFSWASGEVELPAGFAYEAHRGIDTSVGSFTSQDERLVISHDIGELAGEQAWTGNFTETLSDGSRVRVARRKESDAKGGDTVFAAVSFPDSGCANFYMRSSSEEDLAAIDFIARRFRPKGRTPSWIRPLLPEILRSDCRHWPSPWWRDDARCESSP